MAIWWIRRDLRLNDNAVLHAALGRGDGLIPVFILDPHREQHPAAKRHAFLYAGLRQLDADLRARGSRLIVRRGDVSEVLPDLVAETQSRAIFAEEAYSPFARRRDDDVARGLPLHLLPGLTIHHPSSLLKPDHTPRTVFTAFRRAWSRLPMPDDSDILPAPAHLPPVPDELLSHDVPEASAPADFAAGEAEAQRRLKAFTSGESPAMWDYGTGRDRLGIDGTSRLSPYLRFGMISARQAAVAARQSPCRDGRGAETWLSELIWREFYHSILFHFPQVLSDAFRADLRSVEWSNNSEDVAAWREGRTGYPVVDAAMRQLVQTGWMHNRARMIVASFLVKDLLVDWRWGERWFMEHLIDGDAAANNGGWQWTAGTGADAAPYFRVFNPIVQSQRFDPDGAFIRRWLPQLASLPSPYIHTPWQAPDHIQRRCGCVIGDGEDYPAPIVDHALARQRALAAYRAARHFS